VDGRRVPHTEVGRQDEQGKRQKFKGKRGKGIIQKTFVRQDLRDFHGFCRGDHLGRLEGIGTCIRLSGYQKIR